MKMKWVTKQNMILWIFLGLGIAFFGISVGIWKDQTQEKNKKKEPLTTDKTETTENKATPTPTINITKTTDTIFRYLTENYSDDEKIRMISQMPELSDGNYHQYDSYNIVLKDKQLNIAQKVESLKQRIAMNYYIPTFLKTPKECMNNYMIPLNFSDPKLKQMMSDTKNLTDTLNTMQTYLKQNNF